MSDKSREQKIRGKRGKRGNLRRKVSFRITPDQATELERMIDHGMNPSIHFREALDKMMHDARGRRF